MSENYENERTESLNMYKAAKQRLLSLEKYLEMSLEKTWALQMKCYLENNLECIEEYNKIRLEQLQIGRHKKAHEAHCYSECSSEERFEKGKIENELGLKGFRLSINCLDLCAEKSIYLVEEEIKLVEDLNIRIKSFHLS